MKINQSIPTGKNSRCVKIGCNIWDSLVVMDYTSKVEGEARLLFLVVSMFPMISRNYEFTLMLHALV